MPRVTGKAVGLCPKAPMNQKLCVFTGLVVLFLAATTTLHAATIWDGPLITYSQPGGDPTQSANQDPLTANVVITRALTQGIFNLVNEAAYVKHTSPTDTEWAVGDLSNATNLSYTTWQLVDGIGKPVLNLPNQQLVLHLVTDDIYLSAKFTALGDHGAGLFTYIRSTPLVVNTPPTVSITNPVHNASFASPASLTIQADATDADGSISGVAFFDDAVPLGSVTNPPYEVAVLFSDGLHPLTAVATDDMGASTTSTLINVNVSTSNLPPLVTITSPTNGAFLAAPANVTLFADASDSDGTVSSVQFYDDSTLLGTDLDSPFSVAALLYPGTHPLSAVALDNSGATSTSTLVSLTVTSEIIPNPIVELIPAGNIAVDLQTIADGLAAPLDLAAPGDGTDRLFVYDQEGRVWVVTNGVVLATPLLDVRDRLVLLGAYDERGLLGFTVHPNYALQPFLYTYTSEPIDGAADFPNGLGGGNNHQAVVAEWRISTNSANVVDPTSRREIMRIDQPQSNHNGGAIHFGPDGMLYIALGDGGSANDVAVGHSPGGNGQDINVVHGKLLRIDVNGNNASNGEYGVPVNNPFVGTNGLDEIWAYGLRNPFSFHFERGTTNLYLADVGQGDIEEVDIIVRGGNYGWSVREGTFWFDGAGHVVTAPVRPVPPDLVDPIAVYDHDDGLAIIGGFVYHGTAIPDLQGRYVFGDWGSFSAPSGRLFYLDDTNGVNELRIGLDDRPLGLWLRGFGEGPDGELYVFCSRQLGPSGTTGRMMKLVPAPDPLRITGLAPSNGTHIAVGVSGGAGPFALQERPTLDDPLWRDAALDATRSVLFPLADTSGFLRTVDVGHLAPRPLSLVLSGGAQHPANASTAEGGGIFRLDGNSLSFDLRYAGLAAVATAAHIHGPADTSADAPPVVVLNAYNGGTWGTNGTLSGVIVLTDVQKAMMLGGQTYVNIHNPTFPGGEVRGQIVPANMHVALRSANAVPDSGTGAHGLGHVVL
ncbi:MAG: PQQ-dependent sugar dehydrogenase, partial [Kiritimatiellae bacterium]|nr:PQQ-dependent sugar dehydrogenase [Kiritimatiellia bacterium]